MGRADGCAPHLNRGTTGPRHTRHHGGGARGRRGRRDLCELRHRHATEPGARDGHTRGRRLHHHQAQQMIRSLRGVNMIGADLVEVTPPFDPSGLTAYAGANLMFEILCNWRRTWRSGEADGGQCRGRAELSTGEALVGLLEAYGVSRRCSASRASITSRCTARCRAPTSPMCCRATSRGPASWPTAMRVQQANRGCASPSPGPVSPTSSPHGAGVFQLRADACALLGARH